MFRPVLNQGVKPTADIAAERAKVRFGQATNQGQRGGKLRIQSSLIVRAIAFFEAVEGSQDIIECVGHTCRSSAEMRGAHWTVTVTGTSVSLTAFRIRFSHAKSHGFWPVAASLGTVPSIRLAYRRKSAIRQPERWSEWGNNRSELRDPKPEVWRRLWVPNLPYWKNLFRSLRDNAACRCPCLLPPCCFRLRTDRSPQPFAATARGAASIHLIGVHASSCSGFPLAHPDSCRRAFGSDRSASTSNGTDGRRVSLPHSNAWD